MHNNLFSLLIHDCRNNHAFTSLDKFNIITNSNNEIIGYIAN